MAFVREMLESSTKQISGEVKKINDKVDTLKTKAEVIREMEREGSQVKSQIKLCWTQRPKLEQAL